MKSYVWLKTVDGSIRQVEEEVAMFCPVICREILEKGMGTSETNAVVLSDQVNPVTLTLILDYCRFHQDPRHSVKERKAFDDKFIQSDTRKLCELMAAAASLQLAPLVDLICVIIARLIEGKNPEEIRATFHFPDDLPEEERLEPLKNVTEDPRIRLLNRLYARKKKELKEKFVKEIIEPEEEPVDNRSVDDLLSFINGEEKECKVRKTKKKNRKKKSHTKVSTNEIGEHKEGNDLSLSCKNGKSSLSSEFPDPTSPFSHELEFDDDYTDDELDPVMKEELDREVEEFARRLNSGWPERVRQLLSSGPERRLTSISMSGNGATQRLNESRPGIQRQ
ncbi:SKP1-like protein 21 isoform X1 [Silene latifolia]|uniref:SKP1-like protein 21 isoform X1 n=1 Tax=Silene latifolia TaxID=37657 RepID=UPI003D7747EB